MTVLIAMSDEAYDVYSKLSVNALKYKKDSALLKAILNKAGFIKQNKNYGVVIAKKLIPEEYKKKYDVKNLFRVELPHYWRMLYTLRGKDEIEIIAFVLDIIDHKQYDKKFKYKKK